MSDYKEAYKKRQKYLEEKARNIYIELANEFSGGEILYIVSFMRLVHTDSLINKIYQVRRDKKAEKTMDMVV